MRWQVSVFLFSIFSIVASEQTRIADTQGRSDSGYTRLFGNEQMGLLISRVHATVIRRGNELERMLRDATATETVRKFDDALKEIANEKKLPRLLVVYQAKCPVKVRGAATVADIVIFSPPEKQIWVVELKDGDTFDTKKSTGEVESLTAFTQWISQRTGWQANYYLCSFNQENVAEIVNGLRGRFNQDNVLTGSALCKKLGIDYAAIKKQRTQLQDENREYFVRELLTIPEVRAIIKAADF